MTEDPAGEKDDGARDEEQGEAGAGSDRGTAPGRKEGRRRRSPQQEATVILPESSETADPHLVGRATPRGAGEEGADEEEWVGPALRDETPTQPTIVLDVEYGDAFSELQARAAGEPVPGEEETVLGARSVDPESPSGEDDVFVILPEALGEEIPVVETEVVAEEEETVEELDLTGDDAFRESRDGAPGGDFPTEIVAEDGDFGELSELEGDDGFDRLAAELDDAVLEGDGQAGEFGGSIEGDESLVLAGIDGLEARRRRLRRRWMLSAAAVLVAGSIGLYVYNSAITRLETPSAPDAGSLALGDPTVSGVEPAVEPPGGGNPDAGGTPLPVGSDPVDDVRRALRERVTLALRLGFQVEVSDE